MKLHVVQQVVAYEGTSVLKVFADKDSAMNAAQELANEESEGESTFYHESSLGEDLITPPTASCVRVYPETMRVYDEAEQRYVRVPYPKSKG